MNGSLGMQKNLIKLWALPIFTVIFLIVSFKVVSLTTVFEVAHWVADEGEISLSDGSWEPLKVDELGAQTDLIEIRFGVEINNSDVWNKPIGIMISGPFSAEVSWDGEFIGRKGDVSSTKESEIPGKIDGLLFLHSKFLSEGTHLLQIKISTQHMNYTPDKIIHLIALGPYREDERRTLRYYAAPILLIGGLVFLMLQNVRIGINAGSKPYLILGLFTGFILLNLLSEISRAIINYPYDLHLYRSSVMSLSNIGAGLCICYLTYVFEKAKWARLLLVAAILLALSNLFLTGGGDFKIIRNFMILVGGPAFIYTIKAVRGQTSFMTMLPIYWLACFISIQISAGIFLDIYLYVATLVFLTSIWFGAFVGLGEPIKDTLGNLSPQNFIVKSRGREIVIKAKEVLFAKAEGNFTELKNKDGKLFLHHLRLGEIMDNPPKNFIRVHRSYAINKKYIKSLRVAEGSKYWVEIDGEDDVPVSRYRVSEVRKALELT